MGAQWLIVAIVILGPLAFGCVEPWSRSGLEVGLLAAFALSLHAPRRPVPGVERVLLPGLLSLAVIGLLQLLRQAHATDPAPRGPFTVSIYETRRACLLWVCYGAMLWAGARAWACDAGRRRLLWAVYAVGIIVAVIGLVQLSFGNRWVYGFRLARYGRSPFGPYFNRGQAASLMAMSLLCGAGLLLSRVFVHRRGAASGEPSPRFAATQAALAAGLGIILAGLWGAGNRGAFLSAAAAAAAVGVLSLRFLDDPASRRKAGAGLLLGLTLAAVGMLFVPSWIGVFKGRLDNSLTWRLAMYAGGLRLWGDFPFFGIGLGALMPAFPPYKNRRLIVDEVDYIHSDWLQIPLETGWVGLVAVALGLSFFLFRTIAAWRRIPSREERSFVGGALAAALSFILHAAVDFTMQMPANAAIFIALLAWLGAHEARQRERAAGIDRASEPSPAPRAALRWSLSAAALVLAAHATRPALAQLLERRAGLPGAQSSRRLQDAHRMDPNPRLLYRMGAECLLRADAEGGNRKLLREALGYSQAALREDPAHKHYRRLYGVILSRMARTEDAKPFL